MRLVIRSFKCDETKRVFDGLFSRKLPQDIQQRATLKLHQLHNANALDDMRIPPSNRLESLSGNRRGLWSIRINRQWRIVFRWSNSGAESVIIEDYH